MDRRPMTRGGARKNNRRLRTVLWIAGTSALLIALIYFEQTAILYLLATLSLAALLMIIAFSDLRGAQRIASASELGDDSAAIGSGITAANMSATAPSIRPPRRSSAKRR